MVGVGSFVRSGTVNLDYGALRNFDLDGYGWSEVTGGYSSATSADAYYLYFDASGVGPSNGPNGRWYGFPVRCLV